MHLWRWLKYTIRDSINRRLINKEQTKNNKLKHIISKNSNSYIIKNKKVITVINETNTSEAKRILIYGI